MKTPTLHIMPRISMFLQNLIHLYTNLKHGVLSHYALVTCLLLSSMFSPSSAQAQAILSNDGVNITNAQQGMNYNQSFIGMGSIDNDYTLLGPLPTGLTATVQPAPSPATFNHVLVISGVPTVSGNFTIGITVATSSGSVGGSYTTNLTFRIAPMAPTVQDKTVTVLQDSSSNSIALTTNGTVTGIQIPTMPAHGSLLLSGTTLFYTPTSAYFGPDSFTVQARGPGGTSNLATVSITVQALPPSIVIDPSTVAANSSNNPIPITLSGPVSALAIETAPQHGSATVSGMQVFYTPATNYAGSDSFSVKAKGPGGDSRVATANINVTAPPPSTVGSSVVVAANSSRNLITPSVSGIFSSLAIESAPSNGQVVVSGSDFFYTPNAGFNGNDSFTFKALGAGNVSNISTINISVTPPAPTMADASFTVANNSSGFSISPVVSGVATALTIASGPSNGQLVINGMSVVYTPNKDFAGADSFTLKAQGPGGSSAAANFNITVLPAAPVVSASNFNVATNSSGNLFAPTITGPATSLSIDTAPAHGSLQVSGLQLIYTPTTNYAGSDSIVLRATGPGGTSAATTLNITVIAAAPTSAPASVVLPANSSSFKISPSLTGLINSLVIDTAPSQGQVNIVGRDFFYTPNQGYSGSDRFSYRAIGPGGSSASSTIDISVTPPAPSIANASITVPGNSNGFAFTPSITGLANSLTLVTAASHGSVSITGLNLTYTPSRGYSGSDSFSLTAVGPGGTSSISTINVTVLPLAPTTSNLSVTVLANSRDNSIAIPVQGTATTTTIATAPSRGSAVVTGTNVLYTPNANYEGSDSFSYFVTGPGGQSATAVATITINPLAPNATDSSIEVLANSVDNAVPNTITGSARSVSIASAAQHGTVSISGTSMSYTPFKDYVGSDSFSFIASGVGGNANPATVRINVKALPPKTTPTAGNVPAGSNGAVITPSISGNVTRLIITTPPSNGSARVEGLTIIYTPNPGFFGADPFRFMAEGSGGSSPPEEIVVTVTAPAPTLEDAALSLLANSPATAIPLKTTGPINSITISALASHGTASITNNQLSYAPAANYVGSDSFTVIASGPGGQSRTATVSITVTDTAPIATSTSATVGFNSRNNTLTPSLSGKVDRLSISTAPSHGQVQVNGLQLVYTPDTNYSGSDRLQYQATGPGGNSNTASIDITVQAGVITVQNLDYTVQTNSKSNTLSPSLTGVVDRITLQTPPSNGTAAVNGLSLSYTPNTNFVGNDSIVIAVSGPGSRTETATLKINVTTPLPTIALGDLQTQANSSNVSLTPQLTGIVDSLVIVTPPAHGVLTVTGLTMSYTPTTDYAGDDSITIAAKGPGGTSAPATARIQVTALPPVLTGDAVSVLANSSSNPITPKIKGNAKTIAISKAAAHGTVTVNGLALNYTPTAGYVGSDTFSITASGDGGSSPPIEIAVTVQALQNSAINLNVATNASVTQVLNSVPGATSYSISTPASHGTASISNNQLRYTPSNNYAGSDSLRVTVNGSNGVLTNIDVSIIVTATAPSAKALSLQVESGRSAQIDLATAISGPAYAGITIKLVNAAAHGTASLNGTILNYTANANYAGSDQIQFTASTIGGTSNLANLAITITARPDPSKDKSVAALVTATTAIVRHFEQIQVEQFGGRLFEIGSQQRQQDNDESKGNKTCGPVGLWLSGLNSYGSYRTRDGSHYTTMAYSGGADRCFGSGKVTAGLGLGYARDHSEIGPAGLNLTAAANTIASYVSASLFPKTRIGFVAGANRIDNNYQRYDENSKSLVFGQWNGTQAFSSSSITSDVDLGFIVFTPFVRFDVSKLALDPYSETGSSPYLLHYHQQTMQSRRKTVGFNSESTIETSWGTLTPRLRVEFQRDNARRDSIKTNYVDFPDAIYLIPNNDLDQRLTLYMLGADMHWKNGLVTIFSLTRTNANQNSNQRFNVRFSYQY